MCNGPNEAGRLRVTGPFGNCVQGCFCFVSGELPSAIASWAHPLTGDGALTFGSENFTNCNPDVPGVRASFQIRFGLHTLGPLVLSLDTLLPNLYRCSGQSHGGAKAEGFCQICTPGYTDGRASGAGTSSGPSCLNPLTGSTARGRGVNVWKSPVAQRATQPHATVVTRCTYKWKMENCWQKHVLPCAQLRTNTKKNETRIY